MAQELALVMPVYNEEACITAVVQAWHDELARLKIDFVMLVLNDGSRDTTGERLAGFADSPRIVVINKTNSGHGPTILQGYRLAVARAAWVFQTDSDNEMGPEYFAALWERRNDFDALFGIRTGRRQSLGRLLISSISRGVVRLLFGAGVVDVNTPYRLMRAPLLAEIIREIPDDTFAPNVVISGMLVATGRKILNLAVAHQERATGKVSIAKLRLWKAAVRSLWQTVVLRARLTKRCNL